MPARHFPVGNSWKECLGNGLLEEMPGKWLEGEETGEILKAAGKRRERRRQKLHFFFG